jgi:spore germination protein KB
VQQKRQYGSWTLAAACGTILLVQSFHPVMRTTMQAGEMAAWLAMLIAGLLAIAIYWPVITCLARLPGGNLIDLARAAAGGLGAIVTGLLVCGLLVFHSAFVVRQTTEMAVSAVYPHTPQTFAVVTLLICAFYGAYGGMAAIVRLCRLYLPFLSLAIVAILVGAVGWGQMGNLLPFWGPGLTELLLRSLLMTAIYGPVLFLLLAAGPITDRQQLGTIGIVVIAGTALTYALVNAMLVMTFPYPMGQHITFPLHEVSRLIIGGRFFERLEGVWLFIWVFGTACHLAALLHAAAVAFAQAFDLPSHRTAVPPLVSMALTIAFFPPDQGEAIAWHATGAAAVMAIGFGLPLGLAAVAALRGRLGRHAT